MSSMISAHSVGKVFGSKTVLDDIHWSVEPGSIVGLIGPNGAGKTTLLRALLGLTAYQGKIEVLGCDPSRQRRALMSETAFIADTAVLPRWMRVEQLLQYVAGVHPKFNRDKADRFLSKTQIGGQQKLGTLSKGMMVQVHLAITLAIEAKLLVLDEPTLGLDILYRKQFFDQLINDYFDADRTIIISTHQVEEVQDILTHFVFLNKGRMIIDAPVSDLETRFLEVQARGEDSQRVGASNIWDLDTYWAVKSLSLIRPIARSWRVWESSTPPVSLTCLWWRSKERCHDTVLCPRSSDDSTRVYRVQRLVLVNTPGPRFIFDGGFLRWCIVREPIFRLGRGYRLVCGE